MTTRSPARPPGERSADLPSAATLRRLKLSPEVAWYLLTHREVTDRLPGGRTDTYCPVCRYVRGGHRLPDCPPKIKTPEPRTVRGSKFDPARVDRVLKSFHLLRHTKGQWAGRPLHPDTWQVAYLLAPVFGWVKYDPDCGRMVRIIRNLYADVSRRNGKSTILGGIGLYLTAADGEKGAEVVSAAITKKQARYVFDPARQLATKAPALKGHVIPRAGRIIHPATASYMEVVSNVAEAMHGGNLHGGIIDELHVHKDAALVEAIETGTGSRTQPLIAAITTADDGRTQHAVRREAQVRGAAGPRHHQGRDAVRGDLGRRRGRRPVRGVHLEEGQPRVRRLPYPRIPTRRGEPGTELTRRTVRIPPPAPGHPHSAADRLHHRRGLGPTPPGS